MIPRYQVRDIEYLWSDLHKYSTWLKIELLILKSMVKHGIAPQSAVDAYEDVELSCGDVDDIQEIEKTTKHDVSAFVRYMQPIGGGDGRWLHYGVTSSDIVDTAFSLILKDAISTITNRATDLLVTLKGMTNNYRDTIMMGRTHGMHAEPITFGVKVINWHSMIKHVSKELDRSANMLSGKVSGSVGTYVHLPPKIEKDVCTVLRLRQTPTTQVVPRHLYANVFNNIAIFGSVIEKIATDIRLLSMTGIDEVSESFDRDQHGSSSMPHKKNPVGSENLCGLSRVLRGYALSAMEDVALWNERDISHSSVERIIAPDATNLLLYMIQRLNTIVSNLIVDEKAMMDTVANSKSDFSSQSRMLGFIRDGVSRDEARRMVNDQTDKPAIRLSEYTRNINSVYVLGD